MTEHISLNNPQRPFIFGRSGEVFWGNSQINNPCGADSILERSKRYPQLNCFSLHYLQSAQGFYRSKLNLPKRNMSRLKYEIRQRTKEDWKKILANKTDTCVMIVGSVFKKGKYFPEALIRYAFFIQNKNRKY